MLHLLPDSRRMDPTRMLAALAALAIVLSVPPPLAAGQEQARPGQESKRVLPGRVFVCCSSLEDPLGGLIAVDPNDGSWSKVTDERDPSARVSLDGKYAVLRTRGNDRSLCIFDVEGKKEPQAIFGDAAAPCGWYADGEHILVSSYSTPLATSPFETWRISADGSKKEKLPIPETEFVQDMSRDGQWLVSYSSRLSPDGVKPGPIPGCPLYLVHPDGSGEHVVRRAEDPQADGGERVNAYSPRFSPDGRKLLWTELTLPGGPARVASGRIVVVECNGSHRRVLLEGTAADRFPSKACWSPDGREIAVTTRKRVEQAQQLIFQVEIVDDGGKPIRIIPLADVAGAPRLVIDWR